MSKPAKLMNKTAMFLALESELPDFNENAGELHQNLETIVASLSPLFENRDLLSTSVFSGGLTYEYAFLRRSECIPWVFKAVQILLAEFRNARDFDPQLFWPLWCGMMPAKDKAIQNAADVALLQGDKEELPPQLMVKSIFRDFGDYMEGTLQPSLRLRLSARGFAGYRLPGAQEVSKMNFGDIVNELSKVDEGEELYKDEKFGISVSQWRNIANHNGYELIGEIVTCEYGSAAARKTVRLTISDLWNVAIYFNNVAYVHKVALEVFSIDNINKIIYDRREAVPEYTLETILAFALSASGFKVIRANVRARAWSLELIDTHNRPAPGVKKVFQQAVLQYLMFVNEAQFKVSVRSSNQIFNFSMNSSLQAKDETCRGRESCSEVFDIDNHLRISPSIP